MQIELIETPDAPPEGGEITLDILMAPVSLQAKRAKKISLKSEIKRALGNPRFLLSGDVAIQIEWLVHERLRYESNGIPDVDNVIKVILDSVSGPDGLMINDSQVQFVSCHWIDWTSFDQKFSIQIKYLADEWVMKNGIRWVKFTNNICFPINKHLPPEVTLRFLEITEKRLNERAKIESKGGTYELSRSLMPIQRPFHLVHLKGFEIIDLAGAKQEINEFLKNDCG